MNYEEIFKELIDIPVENECIELKEAKNNFDFGKLGKYFSALSNEANLNNRECAWLIFGVEDKKREIVGTRYRENKQALESLKTEIANKTNDRMTFINIYELQIEGKRVLMFQIPAAIKGIPTSWKGHYYGRDSENLYPLSLNKLERIRKQMDNYDWSADIIEEATITDLDEEAIMKAKKEYIAKHIKLEKEVNSWDTITFLNKAGICINSKITNTAMILLGKKEKAYLLGNYAPQITWVLQYKNKITPEDYEHFNIPLILTVDKVLAKIRNLTYRYIPIQTTLFPIEIPKYEAWAFDNEYYKDMILKFISEYKIVKRSEIDSLLMDKLSNTLNDEQKKRKIKHLLDVLSNKENKIENKREGSVSYWKLSNT